MAVSWVTLSRSHSVLISLELKAQLDSQSSTSLWLFFQMHQFS